MNPADVRNDILTRLRHWRWRLLWQRLIVASVIASVYVLARLLLAASSDTLPLQISVITIVVVAQLVFSRKRRILNADNFLLHLNRRFPDFEESAQLLLQDEQTLSSMQVLQRSRAQSAYAGNLARVELWQPQLTYRMAISVVAICVLLSFFSADIRSFSARWLAATLPAVEHSGRESGATRIEHIAIHIQPPAYTGLKAVKTDQLDLELAEGSHVQWSLSFNSVANGFALEMTGGERIALTPDGDGHWQGNATVSQTDLYRIIEISGGSEKLVGSINSLTVALDQAPDIRIIEPDVSMLEIPKNGPARFSSRVLIQDDFGIEEVTILASVAKGSGEGVKFRDLELAFDSSAIDDQGLVYLREWDLAALGMEAGDEVYFTVIATDNKQPQANTGRSETMIVRWLQDEPTRLAADGLAIDFIPEFFKSQRQIIIDTEQLLEDEKNLQHQVFKDTSYEIGQAQADLKHKYGQYLGDEFGEGPGEQLGIMHEIAEARENAAGEGESGEIADEHQHADTASINTRINSTTEILELFGHNHGDAEIGPITSRNPVALMKRAVSEMWQAEKHLLQAEPEQALPFEYEAYKYLKLARQAERIYVKRLGFEPPPVTEDRRLSGELDEILTYHTTENTSEDNLTGTAADQWLLRSTYQLLSEQPSNLEFTPSQRQLLSRLSKHLMGLSQQRPGLIIQAASVEKLLLAGHLQVGVCPHCSDELRITLWNLMDDAAALLHQGKAAWMIGDELIQAYQRELQQDDPAVETRGDRR